MNTFHICAHLFSFLLMIHASGTVKSGCLERQKALTLLEAAEDLLSKAEKSFPYCRDELNSTNQSDCSEKKSLAYIGISKKFISDVRQNFPTCTGSKVIVQNTKYKDCSEILASGRKESGVYTVWLSESNSTRKQVQAYCDMNTDGGGWTVIQRRGKFSTQEDFFRDFETYKNGFGNITQEFWLGNENIRILCDKGCEIRFDLQDKDGIKGYAVYKNFELSKGNYKISISGYVGDVGDSMKNHDGFFFSTKDKGFDTKTANSYRGAWWYSSNNYSILNGIYQPGKSGYEGIVWWHWRQTVCLAGVEIKVKPKSM